MPEAAGLGAHLTLGFGGQAKFGPDVQWVAGPDDLPVDPSRGDAFYTEVRKYWPPGLRDGALIPACAGIRPKIHKDPRPRSACCGLCRSRPDVQGVHGLVNLFGIDSPGLTSCLALAQHVATLV